MDRYQARRLFEASRRFPCRAGGILVRDVELAAMIATVKAERRAPAQQRPYQCMESRAG